MLVLTRKYGEQIVIKTEDGKEVVITLVKVKGNQARIGVEADKSVSIYRKEILQDSTEETALNA